MSKPPKQDESLTRRLSYEFPYFEDLVEPKGFLTIDRASHACFYYAFLAMKARNNAGPIESQIIEYKVGDTPPEWREQRDSELAVSVAVIYALESPEIFLAHRKRVWLQCKQLGLDVPDEVFNVSPKSPSSKLIH